MGCFCDRLFFAAVLGEEVFAGCRSLPCMELSLLSRALCDVLFDVWARFRARLFADMGRRRQMHRLSDTSVRCGLIVLDERWFQRLRSSTETLKRSATVTSVSPAALCSAAGADRDGGRHRNHQFIAGIDQRVLLQARWPWQSPRHDHESCSQCCPATRRRGPHGSASCSVCPRESWMRLR